MVTVFDYLDFHRYLADYYEEQKTLHSYFSYKYLANRAGFDNKGFVYNLIKGKKTLSKTNAFKLSKALGHSKYEMEYFAVLVTFNESKNRDEKKYLFEKLNQLCNQGRKNTEAQILRQDQYTYYSEWYHVVIRSLIDMYEFSDDYKWLAGMVKPKITVKQAKQSVQLLKKLGLIEKKPDGFHAITSKALSTGPSVLSMAIENFHLECTGLAEKSLKTLQGNERNFTGLTIGISKDTYKRIGEEILKFQQSIIDLVSCDKKAQQVYQFNFQLFPTSDTDTERRRYEK